VTLSAGAALAMREQAPHVLMTSRGHVGVKGKSERMEVFFLDNSREAVDICLSPPLPVGLNAPPVAASARPDLLRRSLDEARLRLRHLAASPDEPAAPHLSLLGSSSGRVLPAGTTNGSAGQQRRSRSERPAPRLE